MQIVLLSAPTPIKREAERINAYLDLGLEVFHLRKPALPETALVRLLERIAVRHLDKIALHSHHHAAEPFGISRLHYPEPLRELTPPELLKQQSESGKILSTSVHRVGSLWEVKDLFDYAFLSPIFPSISKKGYGEAFDPKKWERVKESPTRTYGLGGISHQNIPDLTQLGFEGAALMGSIWKKPHQEALKELEYCLQYQH